VGILEEYGAESLRRLKVRARSLDSSRGSSGHRKEGWIGNPKLGLYSVCLSHVLWWLAVQSPAL
jgi:hypothetical protein